MPPKTSKTDKDEALEKKKSDAKVIKEEDVEKTMSDVENLIDDLGIEDIVDAGLDFTYDGMTEDASAPVKPTDKILMLLTNDDINEFEDVMGLNKTFNRIVLHTDGNGKFTSTSDDPVNNINHFSTLEIRNSLGNLASKDRFNNEGNLLIDFELLGEKIGRFSSSALLGMEFEPESMMWLITANKKNKSTFESFGSYDKRFPVRERLWDEEDIDGIISYSHKGKPMNNMIEIKVGKLKRISEIYQSFGAKTIPLKAHSEDGKIGVLDIKMSKRGETYEDEINIEEFTFVNGKSAEVHLRPDDIKIFNAFASDEEVKLIWGNGTPLLIIYKNQDADYVVETKTSISVVIPPKRTH